MIEPNYTETFFYPSQADTRLRQLRARFVPSKSTSTRRVYWIQERNTWILVTQKNKKLVLGYYQMERCPCDD
jgi:hypothetical protein